jgi:hypothetical protein
MKSVKGMLTCCREDDGTLRRHSYEWTILGKLRRDGNLPAVRSREIVYKYRV